MIEEAPEHGLDVEWVEAADKPKRSHSVGESFRSVCLQSIPSGEIVLPGEQHVGNIKWPIVQGLTALLTCSSRVCACEAPFWQTHACMNATGVHSPSTGAQAAPRCSGDTKAQPKCLLPQTSVLWTGSQTDACLTAVMR